MAAFSDRGDAGPSRLSVKGRGRRSRVEVRGDLDWRTGPHLDAAIDRVSRPGQVVIVDLTALTFCDCAGLGVLVGQHNGLRSRGGVLVITHPPRLLTRLFTLTCLDRELDIRCAATAGY